MFEVNCLKINYDFVVQQPKAELIINNIKQALFEIGKESDLNALRVKKFGIEVVNSELNKR